MDDTSIDIPTQASGRGWKVTGGIGSGGQGRAVRVLGVRGERGVLKILSDVGPVAVGRMRREIDILIRVNHPAVVPLLDHGFDPIPWYVTPEGVDLKKYWKNRIKEVPSAQRFDEALRIIRTLTEGLSVLHQVEGGPVVHRDIKPANVIMLDDGENLRPALIDFGIAYRPEDERLSVIDGRPALNRFAAPPDAYYGTIDEPAPPWDCLGAAWLWGWLLAAGQPPLEDRYHWKFHVFIDDPRCEAVRAVIASCSVPGQGPRDGAGLARLIDAYFPRTQPPPVAAADFGAAMNAWSQGKAQQALTDAAWRERGMAAATSLAVRFGQVITAIREVAAKASAGLPVATTEDLTSDRNMSEVLTPLTERSVQCEARLIEFRCGTEEAPRFNVYVSAMYRPAEQAYLPLSLIVSVRTYDLNGHDYEYRYAEDGRVRLIDSRGGQSQDQEADDQHAAQLVQELMAAPEYWRPPVRRP